MGRTFVYVVATCIAVSGALAGHARADNGGELGGFIGVHFFSEDNLLLDSTDDGPPDDAPLVGARFGWGITTQLSVELEAAFIPSETIGDAGISANVLGVRGHAMWHFTDGRVVPFALVGAGTTIAIPEEGDTDADYMWHVGVGAKAGMGQTWGLRFDGRLLTPPQAGDAQVTTDFELMVGVYKWFGAAEPAPEPEPEPEPVPQPVDADGDGLFGENDNCPTDAEDKDGFEDTDGCPDLDNDQDGILDASDRCINTPEDDNGIDQEDGCPESDDDGDGLLGSRDSCPADAEDKDGFEDDDGCPEPDNDRDGVADADDKCPAELENLNGFEDTDGCPDVIPAKIAKYTGRIRGIRFRTGSAKIRRSSNRVLARAVKVLEEFPDIRLEIQGHTDNVGDAAANKTLSEERAEAVKLYMVEQGIDPSRLEATGYGLDRPIGDNTTRAGRKLNRRVEFVLIAGGTAPAAPEAAPQPAEPTP